MASATGNIYGDSNIDYNSILQSEARSGKQYSPSVIRAIVEGHVKGMTPLRAEQARLAEQRSEFGQKMDLQKEQQKAQQWQGVGSGALGLGQLGLLAKHFGVFGTPTPAGATGGGMINPYYTGPENVLMAGKTSLGATEASAPGMISPSPFLSSTGTAPFTADASLAPTATATGLETTAPLVEGGEALSTGLSTATTLGATGTALGVTEAGITGTEAGVAGAGAVGAGAGAAAAEGAGGAAAAEGGASIFAELLPEFAALL